MFAWSLVVGTVAVMVDNPFVQANAGVAEIVEEEISEHEARAEPDTWTDARQSEPSWLSHDRQAQTASRERGAPPTPPPER